MSKTKIKSEVCRGDMTNVRLDKRKGTGWNYLRRNVWLYAFAVPALIWLIVFCYIPMGGIVAAFKRYTGALSLWESKWVGIRWFQSFFKSYYFDISSGSAY